MITVVFDFVGVGMSCKAWTFTRSGFIPCDVKIALQNVICGCLMLHL